MPSLSSPLPVTDETKLIGWLCIARHQWSNGVECTIPSLIAASLIRRGLLKRCDGRDGCVGFNAHLTDRGVAISDLYAPEWGINPLPKDSNA